MAAEVRVLIVEDNEADSELALRKLRKDGIALSAVRVASEQEFRAALRTGEWDIIISDFSLPGFDGLSALTIATGEAPHIPFLFLSGTIGEERAIDALQRGAVDYVLKSNLNRLAPAVRRALSDAAQRAAQRVAEDRLRDVIETAQDWIWELDRDGCFTFSSDSVRTLLGFEPSEIVGRHYSDFLDETDRSRIADAMGALRREARTLPPLTAKWRHCNGELRWFERHALALLNPVGEVTGFRGADRDVTERERQQARIMRLTRALQMLSGINTAVVRIRERKELLREACRISTSVGGYAAALVAVLDAGTGTARPLVWVGLDDSVVSRMEYTVAQTPNQDATVPGRVLRSGSAFVCNDVAALEDGIVTRFAIQDLGFRALVALPLTVDRTTVGVLMLMARETGAVSDRELRVLNEVAANLSFALQYLAKESAVKFLSYYDRLTGLAQHSLFCERLTRYVAKLGMDAVQPAIAVFDIEHLSVINDSHGRHAGDHLLQKIADRLKQAVDSSDQLAYLGAGSFAVVLRNAGTENEALRMLRDISIGLFDAPFEIDGKMLPVTVKSGLACRGVDGADAKTLLQNAEAALRQAKAAGEKYLHHRLDLSSKLAERLALEHKLRTALEKQQYVLYYQPKIDLRSGLIEGVEALLRWRDPDRGMISPAEFLPVRESTGMIVPVGEWVLNQAAADCRRWRAAGLRPVHVAVNCTPLQLRRPTFVDHILGLLDGWAFEGWGIDVEITESLLVDEASPQVEKLRLLREAGVRIAIDDFGTGYSSLSRLSVLPVDTLKIDRSFISGLPNDRASAQLVPTIINLARAFELVTVAEGVETPEQLAYLKRTGCDQSQGYLHARPMPAEQLETMLVQPEAPIRPQTPCAGNGSAA